MIAQCRSIRDHFPCFLCLRHTDLKTGQWAIGNPKTFVFILLASKNCKKSAATKTFLWLLWLLADCCGFPVVSMKDVWKTDDLFWQTSANTANTTESKYMKTINRQKKLAPWVSNGGTFTLKVNVCCFHSVSRCLTNSLGVGVRTSKHLLWKLWVTTITS